jgi:hypothetical protein
MVCLYGLAAACVLNMWSRNVDGRRRVGGDVPLACDVADVLKIHYSTCRFHHGTNCYTKTLSRSDYLEPSTQGTTDAKFGTWVFRCFY